MFTTQSVDTWYYIGNATGAFSYMIKAQGITFDIDTVKQFTNIGTVAGLTSGGRTVAWGNYDNDGWDDAVCSGVLYHNNGEGTFTYTGISFGTNTSWGDFNGNGWLDAVSVTYPMGLWRSGGDGSFTNFTDSLAFIDYNNPKNGAGFGNINGDGWLNLYVTYSETWYDPPGTPIYYADHLYLNEGGTSLIEVTDSFAPVISAEAYTRSISFCDFDTDGDQDIYIGAYRLLQIGFW